MVASRPKPVCLFAALYNQNHLVCGVCDFLGFDPHWCFHVHRPCCVPFCHILHLEAHISCSLLCNLTCRALFPLGRQAKHYRIYSTRYSFALSIAQRTCTSFKAQAQQSQQHSWACVTSRCRGTTGPQPTTAKHFMPGRATSGARWRVQRGRRSTRSSALAGSPDRNLQIKTPRTCSTTGPSSPSSANRAAA